MNAHIYESLMKRIRDEHKRYNDYLLGLTKEGIIEKSTQTVFMENMADQIEYEVSHDLISEDDAEMLCVYPYLLLETIYISYWVKDDITIGNCYEFILNQFLKSERERKKK